MASIRSYSELMQIDDFYKRFEYLNLHGDVGCPTFGSNRWMNQEFYMSYEWRQLRHFIIARDEGCDLGWPEFPIYSKLVIHHINPLTTEQMINDDFAKRDPENLITTTHRTHNAIHYGDESQLPRVFVERTPGDTTLWKVRT